MEKQKWTWAKKLYLILAIMLTIQIIPLVGTALNYSFVYAIIGIVLSITILSRTKRDNRSAVGAILGLITFLMAIISGLIMYTLMKPNILIYPSPVDSSDYILKTLLGGLWMICSWFVGISAAILSYINTFSKRDQIDSSDYVSVGKVINAENNTVHINQAVQLGFGAPTQTVAETPPQVTVGVHPTPVVQINIPEVVQTDNNATPTTAAEKQVLAHERNVETIPIVDGIIPAITVESSDKETEMDDIVSDENDII